MNSISRLSWRLGLKSIRSCSSRFFSPESEASSAAETSGADIMPKLDSQLDMDQLVESIGVDVATKASNRSFAKMLRDSKLMQLGDINGRAVVGRIVNRVQDDVYIDVGLKFNAVCKVPAVHGELYQVGSQVLVRLHDVELSERFLGSKRDLTLLEADATLIRLLTSGHRKRSTVGTPRTNESGSTNNELSSA